MSGGSPAGPGLCGVSGQDQGGDGSEAVGEDRRGRDAVEAGQVRRAVVERFRQASRPQDSVSRAMIQVNRLPTAPDVDVLPDTNNDTDESRSEAEPSANLAHFLQQS